MKRKSILALILVGCLLFGQTAFAEEIEENVLTEVIETEEARQTKELSENPENTIEGVESNEEQTGRQNEDVEKFQPIPEDEVEEDDSQSMEAKSFNSNAEENIVLYLGYPVMIPSGTYYNSNQFEEVTVSFSDNTICKGSAEIGSAESEGATSWNSSDTFITLEGLKEGKATVTVTWSRDDGYGNGTVYSVDETYNIIVKGQLPDDAVPFKDIVLRSIILNECGVSSNRQIPFNEDGYVSYEEMESISQVFIEKGGNAYGWYWPEKSVESFDGLQYAHNLKDLIIHDQEKAIDLNPIWSLSNLEQLTLDNLPIIDIGGIENLQELTDVNICNMNISDVSGLALVSNLYTLRLENCSSLQTVRPLFGLIKELGNFCIIGTGVSDAERLEIMELYMTGITKGDKIGFTRGILEDNAVFSVENKTDLLEIDKEDNYSGYTLLAREKGTAMIKLLLNGVEREVTVEIAGASDGELELGEEITYTVENISSDLWGTDNWENKNTILTSNGDLWQLYPEAKRVRGNVKKYVSDWVYSGTDASIQEYILDNNNVLWADKEKIAENVKTFTGHYVLDNNNVLTDIYNESGTQIRDVDSWIELSISPIRWEHAGKQCSTYLLKTDGSLWTREEVEKSGKENIFEKIADNVKSISEEGYISTDGTNYDYEGNEISERADIEYDEEGNCYVGRYRHLNVGKIRVKAVYDKYYSMFYLTEEGDLYYCHWTGNDWVQEKISSDVEELIRSSYYSSGVLCKKTNGKYYDIDSENNQLILLKYVTLNSAYDSQNYQGYFLELNLDSNEKEIQKNGITILDHVMHMWEYVRYQSDDIYGEYVYAVRTDGTVWKIENGIPVKVADLNDLGVQKGNLNGDEKVNVIDLMMCLHHVSGKTALTGNALVAADIDGDGKTNIVDLMRLLHYVSGRNSEL